MPPQGLGRGWSAYAKSDLGTAVADLCLCLFSSRGPTAASMGDKYPVAPNCSFALAATAAYVACTLLVTFAVNGVLEHGSALLLYRTLNASVALAFAAMALYSAHSFGLLAPALNGFDVLGLAVVLLGLEVYHRGPEPESEGFLTQWSPS